MMMAILLFTPPQHRVANFQAWPRILPELQLIPELQESVPLDKNHSLEGGLYGIYCTSPAL